VNQIWWARLSLRKCFGSLPTNCNIIWAGTYAHTLFLQPFFFLTFFYTMPGRRIHRLPQRLDFALIPAPLDISLPAVAEKSPFPVLIVTPSSPAFDNDYSIAFLHEPSPPKPSLYNRIRGTFNYPKTPEYGADRFPETPRSHQTHPSFSAQEAESLLMHTPNAAGGFVVRALPSDADSLMLGHDKGSWKRFRTPFLMALVIVFLMCHLAAHSLFSRSHVLDFEAGSSDPAPLVMEGHNGIIGTHGVRLSVLDSNDLEDGAQHEKERAREFVVVETRPHTASLKEEQASTDDALSAPEID
jgi:hypothetical protein